MDMDTSPKQFCKDCKYYEFREGSRSYGRCNRKAKRKTTSLDNLWMRLPYQISCRKYEDKK